MKARGARADLPPEGAIHRAPLLILVPLLLLLGLRPPETLGASMVVCSALAVLFLCVAWRPDSAQVGRVWLVVGAAVALPVCLTASAPGASIQPVVLFLAAGALGLAAAGLRHPATTGRVAAMALASAAAGVSVHALYQKLWGMERLAERIAASPWLPDQGTLLGRAAAGRAYGLFGTPAALGGFLVLALPISVGLARDARGRLRWAWAGAALLQAGALLASASATATASLLLALLLAAWLWGEARRRVLLAACIAVVVILAGVVAARGHLLVAPTDPGSPWRLRAGNFRAALAMAADHPWRGVGPGGFAERYPSYRREGDNETRHVHDLPLELVAETGWVAGLSLSALFFWLFLAPLRRVGRGPPHWPRGVALGLAVFALHNVGDFTAFMPSLLWSAALLRGSLPPGSGAARPLASSGGWRIVSGAALAVGTLAVLLTGLSGAGRELRLSAREAAFAGDPELAQALAERSVRLAPWDPDSALFLARATARGDQIGNATPERRRLALERADFAVSLSPLRPAAHEARARIRLALGDYPGAYADLVEAARLYPLNGEYASARDGLEARIRTLLPPARGGAP